jgi:hypothetical protein
VPFCAHLAGRDANGGQVCAFQFPDCDLPGRIGPEYISCMIAVEV